MNKFTVLAFCAVLVASARAQSMAEMAALSAMMNRGSSTSGSGNPLASMLAAGSSSSSSTTSGASNPLAALMGGAQGSSASSGLGAMGSMGGAMMMGGAEMSHMMDFYMCGMMRMPVHFCLMMMQQNM